MAAGDLAAIWLTVRLASTVTFILLLLGTPIAWWLANTKSRLRIVLNAIVALPLVLPPTVLGFYLLLALGPDGPIGQFTQATGIGILAFTFWGLVVGSFVYSLPFVVQPLQNAFQSLGQAPLEVAATLGAGPIDRFTSIVIPLCKPGFITATTLGFAHTVGEFGVVLMIGGNIPEQTRVLSVQIYNHVEALQYAQAHQLSGLLLVFSFFVLTIIYSLNKGQGLLRFRQ